MIKWYAPFGYLLGSLLKHQQNEFMFTQVVKRGPLRELSFPPNFPSRLWLHLGHNEKLRPSTWRGQFEGFLSRSLGLYGWHKWNTEGVTLVQMKLPVAEVRGQAALEAGVICNELCLGQIQFP